MLRQRVNCLSDGTAGLTLVSAWNDSGGGYFTRLLDGHSRLRGWPFELLLGVVREQGTQSIIHDKYRWPVFDLAAPAESWFDAILDAELKPVLVGNAPPGFSAFKLPVTLEAWRRAFCARNPPPLRKAIVAAYIDSWFDLMEDKPESTSVLGHCPSLVLDIAAVLDDFPDARILHVIRDPTASLGDFRRRHPGFDADRYAFRWTLVNGAALAAKDRHPGAVHLISYEALRDAPEAIMRRALDFLGLAFEPTVLSPSWRGQPCSDQDLGPFGGIRTIGIAHDQRLRESLAPDDRQRLTNGTSTVWQRLQASLPETHE